MTKTYLKRIAAPRTWPIVRRGGAFIARPKPKGQPMELSLPMVVIMRDMLKLVKNAGQASKVLQTQDVLVNGRRVRKTSDSAGFMDVVTAGGESHRVLISKKNVLMLVPVKKGEELTLQRIRSKTSLKGGKTQLNFTSGANIIAADKGASYKVGDTLALESDKLGAHYALEKGAAVFVTGGSHIGEVGTVDHVEGEMVTVTAGAQSFQTARRYVYVVGKGKPAITMNG
jgi:small subunit ribosomal protein S4e